MLQLKTNKGASINKWMNRIPMLIFLFLSISQLSAQNEKEFLSAKESEPSNFGWMQGFPPPADKVLHTWDGSFFEFPAIYLMKKK